MSTIDSDEFLQAILSVSERVSTIFANHIPHNDYDEIAEGLIAVVDSLQGRSHGKPLRMIVAGALAAVGRTESD